jgi:hypothetical protein
MAINAILHKLGHGDLLLSPHLHRRYTLPFTKRFPFLPGPLFLPKLLNFILLLPEPELIPRDDIQISVLIVFERFLGENGPERMLLLFPALLNLGLPGFTQILQPLL